MGLSRYGYVAGVALLGCASASQLAEPCTNFRKATVATVEVVTPCIVQWNQPARAGLYLDSFEDIEDVKQAHRERGLSAKGIQTRLALMKEISAYAQNLEGIATSKTPQQLEENAKAMETSLKNLGSTIDTVSGSRSLSSAAGPIGAVTRAAGRVYIERERREAIRSAVQAAAPVIDARLKELSSEVTKYQKARRNAIDRRYTAVMHLHNKSKETWSAGERSEALRELNGLANEAERLEIYPSGDLLAKMREAHAEMNEAVANLDQIENLEQFVAAIRNFATYAQDFRNVYDSIRA